MPWALSQLPAGEAIRRVLQLVVERVGPEGRHFRGVVAVHDYLDAGRHGSTLSGAAGGGVQTAHRLICCRASEGASESAGRTESTSLAFRRGHGDLLHGLARGLQAVKETTCRHFRPIRTSTTCVVRPRTSFEQRN